MRALLDAALLTFSNYLSAGLSMVANLVARVWVAPATFGAVSLLQGIYGYIGAYNNIYRNAISREVPIHRSRDEREEEVSVLETAFTLLLISILAESAALVAVGFLVQEQLLRFAFWTFAVFSLFDGLSAAYRVTLVARLRFRSTSVGTLISGAFQAALIVGFSWLWNLHGFFLALALTAMVKFAIYGRALGIDQRAYITRALHWGTVRRILRVGASIGLHGVLLRLLLSIDRFFVAAYLGLNDLGYYSLGVAALGTLYLLPSSIAGAFFPRMMGFLATGKTDMAASAAQRVQVTVMLLTVITIAATILAMDPLVSWMLPDYRGAVPVIEVMLLGGYFYGTSAVAIRIHYGTLQLKRASFITALGTGLVGVLAFSLVGFGMIGVASATTVAIGVYALSLNWSAQQLLPLGHRHPLALVRWMVTGLALIGPVYGLLHFVGMGAGVLWLLGLTAWSVWYLARLYRIRWRTMPSALYIYFTSQDEDTG